MIGDSIMKQGTIFILLLTACLIGCTQKGSNASVGSVLPENAHTEEQQPGEICKVDDLQDSLSPKHVYTFDYADSSFPCEPEGGAMIKGFDTDGNGRLYIAGGNPIRLVCYDRQHKAYDRTFTDATCNNAIMSLYGDSILFMEESLRRLTILSASSGEVIQRYNLPLAATDSIMSGVFIDGNLELEVHDNSIETDSYEAFTENTHVFSIPAPDWDTKTERAGGPKPKDFLTDEAKSVLENYDYKGLHHGMHLFYRHELFLGDIALVDKSGNVRINKSLKGVPPINTCCGEDEHIGWFSSANLYRVKGYSFFLSAYDDKDKTISFLEYDLKPLYEIANNH